MPSACSVLLLRSFFSRASFLELCPPVSLEVLVHSETLDITADLVGRRTLATLPLTRGTWWTFTARTVSGGRIALR